MTQLGVMVALAGCGGSTGSPSPEPPAAQDMGAAGPAEEMGTDEEMGPGAVEGQALLAPDGRTWSQPVSPAPMHTLRAGSRGELLWLEGDGGLAASDGARWEMAMPMGSLLAACELDEGRWLISTPTGLELLDGRGRTPSPIADLVPQPPTQLVALGSGEERQIWMVTPSGLYVWQRGELERVEADALAAPLVLTPGPALEGQAALWVGSARGVHALWRTDQGVEVLTSMDRGPIGALAASSEAIWALVDGEVWRRGDEPRWQRLRTEGAMIDLAANPQATDLWMRDEAGATWHLALDELAQTPEAGWEELAAVDAAGRLVTGAPGEPARRFDRRLRVEIAAPAEAGPIEEPVTLAIDPSFPDLLEDLTATVGGQPQTVRLEAAELDLDPAPLGPGAHTLEVEASWRGVTPRARARLRFEVATGEIGWETHVRPIFAERCASCHGVQANKPLHTAGIWEREFSEILEWTRSGNMPPGDLPKLTDAQLELLERWREEDFPQ